MLTLSELQRLSLSSHFDDPEINTRIAMLMDPDFMSAFDPCFPDPVQPSTPKGMPAPKNGLRWRRFIFTLNNYTDKEYRKLKMLPNVKWMIIGKETAPGTGTKHLQGAVVLSKQVAFRTLKNTPGLTRAHMQVMKGTPSQSKAYCSKQDPNPYERGSLPEPGKRTDLETAAELLTDGMTMKDLARTMPATVAHYCNGLTKLRALLLDGRKTKPCVIWLHGETGKGKTRTAHEIGNIYKSCWMSNDTLRWMDGYDGQTVAILDDFRPDDCPFNLLLKLLDRYPLLVQFKGGYVDWIPDVILITSPMPPEYMYQSKVKDDIAQLLRRIDYIFEFPLDNATTTVLEAICAYNRANAVTEDSESDTAKVNNVNDHLVCDEGLDEDDVLELSKKHATMVDTLLESSEEDKTVVMSISDDEDIMLDSQD